MNHLVLYIFSMFSVCVALWNIQIEKQHYTRILKRSLKTISLKFLIHYILFYASSFCLCHAPHHTLNIMEKRLYTQTAPQMNKCRYFVFIVYRAQCCRLRSSPPPLTKRASLLHTHLRTTAPLSTTYNIYIKYTKLFLSQ